MYQRSATLLIAVVFVAACGSTAPQPAAPPATPAAPTAHQAEAKPKLPQKQATPGHGGHDSDAKKKTKLTFDMPPGWERAPESSVPKPWLMAFYNRPLTAQVLVQFDVHSSAPAAEVAAAVAEGICSRQNMVCSKPQPLASGDGASFTLTRGTTKGIVAIRDLDGSGRCQLQLFGLWQEDSDAKASAGLQTMLNSAEVQ